MLGTHILDAEGVDGAVGAIEGLGLLQMVTRFGPEKIVRTSKVQAPQFDLFASGYEIHAGTSDYGENTEVFMRRDDTLVGVKAKGQPVYGTYLHGLFEEGDFRQAFISAIGGLKTSSTDFLATIDRALDELADALEDHLDLNALLDAAK